MIPSLSLSEGAAAAGRRHRRPRPWRQAIKWAMLRALPRRLITATGPPDRPGIYLTFDDGPHPEYTPRLLDLLKEHGVTATFFVIGERAAHHPELVRRMAAEGHTVGHHTYYHSAPASLSARRCVTEVRQTRALLRSLIGRAPSLFRPPHGQLTGAKLLRLWLEGQTVVLWSSDPRDYSCRGPDELAARLAAHPPGRGDIVLLHDIHPHALGALPALIAEARRRGEEFRCLADSGGEPGVSRTANGHGASRWPGHGG